MFTFSDELVFGTSTTSESGHQIHNDLIMDHANYMDTNLLSFATSHGNGWLHGETTMMTSFEPSSLQRKAKSKNGCSSVRKLVVHREVEKQRRKEMSTLCASLGSLLPLGQINKGKRSVCDQIQEAVDHIKQTEKNIERLRIRRDKLKKSLGLSNPKTPSSSSAANDCVTVNLDSDGVEILISTPDLRLSRLHAVLAQRQLDVVSCVSTSSMGRFFQIIKIEVLDMTSFDASELQDKLNDAIK